MSNQNGNAESVFFKTTKIENVRVIVGMGEFVYQTLSPVKEQFYKIFVKDEPFILDLSNVTQIDSTGFGFILNIVKQLKSKKDMIIYLKDEFILELFTITKIDKLVPIVSTLEVAVREINQMNHSISGE